MRRGNGTAVGAEQQLARHPGTVFGVFPAFKLCHSTPQQTQLCALQPSIWEESEAGGFTGSSPTVVLGVDGEKLYKPLITQGLFRLQQPCAPCVVEARWGPPCADTARDRHGCSAARGGGQVCASWEDPLAPDGSGR